MDLGVVKALHIIFVVTWFAGLFYIVRLFIYHVEAFGKEEPEKSILINQYKLMSKRLWYIITWPSSILALGFGLYLFLGFDENLIFIRSGWMHLKLGFVALLVLYQIVCQRIYSQLQNDVLKWTSMKMRMWNEVATLLLFIIVFLVVLKSGMNTLTAVLGFVLLAVFLMLGIKLYKRTRKE